MNGKRITTKSVVEKKKTGEKITVLTAYDYPTARLIDDAGVDIILVGDSLGQVVLGLESTLPVTMDNMIHHASAVVRGVEHALVVGDMPFMTYQISPEEALGNAGRYMQEACIHAVKLEGGHSVIDAVKRIIDAGIPVMGHLGYTPQSTYQFGGPRVQGRTESEAERILSDARELEAAGVFSIVLEVIPQDLARKVTAAVSIPTIGIGAGPHCDGQVLVVHDLLGLTMNGTPKHAKGYADLGTEMTRAFKEYVKDVKHGTFPGEEHSF
jgi:3-methyl-2-oxobutanoate hydroxymethyltransferase